MSIPASEGSKEIMKAACSVMRYFKDRKLNQKGDNFHHLLFRILGVNRLLLHETFTMRISFFRNNFYDVSSLIKFAH